MTTQIRTEVRKDVTVERISDLKTFLSLETEWDAFLKVSGQQTVYLSHRWIAGWLRFFGRDKHLWILIVKDRHRWIGAVPLVQSVQHWHGFPVRILHFPISFASGNLRCDFILSEDWERAVLTIAKYLKESAGEWDRWELSGLPADSPALAPLRDFFTSSSFHTTAWQPQHSYYYLPISGGFDAFLEKKSRRFRKTLRNHENRLGQTAGAAYRTLKNREEIMKGMETLLDLEARSSKASQLEMTRLEGEIRDFYRYLAESFAKSGDAQIDLIEIDGNAIAALFSLRMEGSLFLLYTCYDPSAASVSPGLLLFRKVLERAWSESLLEIDFNGWTPNVLIWADQHRPFLKGNVYNSALRSQLIRFWEWTAATSLRRAFKRRENGMESSLTSVIQKGDYSASNHRKEMSQEEIEK